MKALCRTGALRAGDGRATRSKGLRLPAMMEVVVSQKRRRSGGSALIRSVRPLNAIVSRNMRSMPTRHSSPEIALRRSLHGSGLRYRLHVRSLPGRPDITFSTGKVAVFVDGCFWHACPEHGMLPRNNRDWWRQKLLANRRRDRAKDRELRALGWLPIHVWEHDDMHKAARSIAKLIQRRRGVVEQRSPSRSGRVHTRIKEHERKPIHGTQTRR